MLPGEYGTSPRPWPTQASLLLDPIRFTDILTTALSIANYQRLTMVEPAQVLDALKLLDGRLSPAELKGPGLPQPAGPPGGPEVAAEVAGVVQRWWDELGNNPLATLSRKQFKAFERDIGMIRRR